jgi:GT2 family glycosyltransferase
LLVVDQSRQPQNRLTTGLHRGCAVRYVHSTSRGLSRARNIGLRAASQEIVLLIDDDMLVEPSWLTRFMDAHAETGFSGAASGRVLPGPAEDGRTWVPAAALVTRAEPATFRARQPIDVLPGAGVALRRDVVLALGGYDERLGPGTRFGAAEDNDLGFRILEAGYEIRHVPAAIALHRPWRSAQGRVSNRWAYGRGKGAFYAKHLHGSDRFMLRRMLKDLRSRSSRALAVGVTSPSTAAREAVSIAAILSGALDWTLRERFVPSPSDTSPSRSDHDRITREGT